MRVGTRVGRRARIALVVAGIVAVGAVVVGGITVANRSPQATTTPSTTSTPVARATPTPTPTPVAVPAAPSAEVLAALPLAYFDAVVPQLLDGSTAHPVNQWRIATPRQPLVALYAAPGADAAPVATLGATVPTINTPAATAVWGTSPGQDGGMLLVSTPSRNRTPGDGGQATAPSATFGWVRAADVTVTTTDQEVVVDNATAAVQVRHRDGGVVAGETARLGSPDDPTPAATATYMEANYIDPQVTYTQGHPITLTGAHSPTLSGYGGNAALTALHYYPDPTGSSHGCVRISAAMTAALAQLPVGTAITFT